MASTRKLYDCFTFFNENDVLEIRFEELYPVVDKFVIVEAAVTFRGNEKPSFYDEKRFDKYSDKVIRVWVDDTPSVPSPWYREFHQRNAIARGLIGLDEDGTVLISDADEIPRRSVAQSVDYNTHDSIRLQVFNYGINVCTGQGHTVKVRRLGSIDTDIQTIRQFPNINIIENGGWEFSSLTDAEGIMYKLQNFSHSEFDNPETISVEKIQARMDAGEDILGFGQKFDILEIDDTWPEAIKDNPEYWSKFKW